MNFSLDYIRQITSPEFLNKRNARFDLNAPIMDTLTIDPLAEAIQEIEQKELVYEWQERSAILEYEGGLNCGDADCVAAVEVLNRTNKKRDRGVMLSAKMLII